MDTLQQYYVFGNVKESGTDKDRQMKASSDKTVAVAKRNEQDLKMDRWQIEPGIGDGKLVTFFSVKYPGKILGYSNSSLQCVANLQANDTQFKLIAAGSIGGEDLYYIESVHSTNGCPVSYLTMDDPNDNREITLKPKLSASKHKQKWKFNKIPSSENEKEYKF